MNPKRTVIVAAVDDTTAADDVLDAAIASVRGYDAGELHFVYVAEPPLTDVLQLVRLTDLITQGRAVLDRIAAAAAEHFAGRIEGHLAVDLAGIGILQVAADLEADLIIVGSHGKSCLQRLVLGSVSRAVVDRARCAVLVVRPPDYPTSPEIEPACPSCLEVQRKTTGATLWCEQHTHHRSLSPHLHYRVAEPFAVGSSLLHPEAAR